MPMAFLLGSLTLMAILWFSSRKVAISRHDLAQAMRAFAAVFGSFATTGLAVGGRFGLAAVAFVATAAFIRSLFHAWRGATPFGGNGKQTKTETAYLKMKLDHESGDMDGVAKTGPFKGILLSLLTIDQLLSLREEIKRNDFESIALIEAYLDHHHNGWRGDGRDDGDDVLAGGDGPMDEERALQILGLPNGANADEIKKAHRQLMGKVHPDRGGSGHLAAQVNAAKEFLLR